MPKTIISENTYLAAQQELKKLRNEGTLFKKLQAVKLAYEHGIKNTADFLNVFPVSIRNWAKVINSGNISSLKIGSKHKDGIKIKKHHKEMVKLWLEKDPNISINLLKDMIEKKFKLKVSKSSVHNIMKSVGFSYITPRKAHYKQNKKQAEEFKKKSTI
jgi:transposase